MRVRALDTCKSMRAPFKDTCRTVHTALGVPGGCACRPALATSLGGPALRDLFEMILSEQGPPTQATQFWGQQTLWNAQGRLEKHALVSFTA
eukprot:5977322-Alexandrium_andersonii.AAC.1